MQVRLHSQSPYLGSNPSVPKGCRLVVRTGDLEHLIDFCCPPFVPDAYEIAWKSVGQRFDSSRCLGSVAQVGEAEQYFITLLAQYSAVLGSQLRDGGVRIPHQPHKLETLVQIQFPQPTCDTSLP